MSQKPMRRPIPGKPAPRRVVKRPETSAGIAGAMTSDDSFEDDETSEAVEHVAPTPVVAATPKKEKVEEVKKVKETPKAAPAAHATEEKEHNNKALPVLLLGVIIILIGVAGYFVSEFLSAKNELEKTSSQLSAIEKNSDDKLNAQKAELEKILAEYDQVKQERSKLGANNQELNAEIDMLRNQLANLNNALQAARRENNNGGNASAAPKASKLSASEKAKYAKEMEQLIATHKVALEERDKEIQKLKHINTHLSSQLNTLSEKHGQLVGNLSSLEERIAVASQLYIENLKVGYKTTKGAIEYDELNEFPAKKVEQIKIGFVIADNKIAEKGFKNFKLKLVDPSGKVLFDSGKSGGSFDSKEGPQFYTSEKDIKFDNEKEEVNFFFVQSAEYKRGQYEAVIFADNKKVGEKRFSIK